MIQTKFPPVILFTVCPGEVDMNKFGEVTKWLQDSTVPFETVTSEYDGLKLPCVLVHAQYAEIAEMKIKEYGVDNYLFINEWREAEIRNQKGECVRKAGKMVKCKEEEKKHKLVFVRDSDKTRQFWMCEDSDNV